MEKYKWFNRSVTLELEHLTEGEIINSTEYGKVATVQKVGFDWNIYC